MQKFTLHIVLALSILLQAVTCATPAVGFAAAVTAPEGRADAVYYVSRTGSNGDGRTWATAWNELDQIDWAVIGPGDTILIDGGPVACRYGVAVTNSNNTPAPAGCGMLYRTALVIGASGTADAPVTIRLAEEAGRDGTAHIFGGRATPLPHCGQTSYAPDRPGAGHGITVNGRSHIVIDGGHWSGIMVYGWTRGIFLSWNGDNQHVTLRNAEVFDNGSWSADNGSDEEAITGSGTGLLFERLILHDNGQDQFQTGYKTPVSDAVFRRSWFYNQRPHPTVRGEPFNYCTHSDGIQFFGDLSHRDITIEDSIVGPGLMHGMMLGETGWIDRVTVRNTLFVGDHGESDNAALLIKDGLVGRDGYVFDHVTVVRNVGAKGWNIYAPGSGYTVRDSLFVGGREVRIGEGVKTGNVCWNISDSSGVCNQRDDPQFVDAEYAGTGEGFADFDFTITNPAIPQGVGSSITSIVRLLADTAPPTASISDLPSASECSDVRLSWEGSDPAPGTGIRSFDVQVLGADDSWTDWLLDTTARSGAYPRGAYGDTIGFRVRARDQAGNVGAYSAARYTSLVDTTPPHEAHTGMLPPAQIPPFMVHWMGADTCGPLAFDVEYRAGDSSIWTTWLAATSETRAAFNPPSPQYGQQYTFRVRARDMGGNSTESDSVSTLLAKYTLSGDVVTVRHQPVIWPRVAVTGALTIEAHFGRYVAYLLGEGDYDLSVTRSGFGVLPPMQLRSGTASPKVTTSLSCLDFVLPPLDDAIDNGGFEDAGWGGWLPGGSEMPAVVSGGHTGGRAVRLGGAGGPSWLSQELTVPGAGADTTLSFLVRLRDAAAGASTLDVALAGAPISHTRITSADEWTHIWLPLDAATGQDAAIGQATTLTFTVPGTPAILLDEVSLGSAISGGSEIRLPLVNQPGTP